MQCMEFGRTCRFLEVGILTSNVVFWNQREKSCLRHKKSSKKRSMRSEGAVPAQTSMKWRPNGRHSMEVCAGTAPVSGGKRHNYLLSNDF